MRGLLIFGIFVGCYPVGIVAIDKDDQQGNRIATAEKLIWKGIRELKRIAKEHPRLEFPFDSSSGVDK